MEERLENLLKLCQGIRNKENGKDLYNKYLTEINSITPKDLITIQYEQSKQGINNENMLEYVDKLINIFHTPLEKYDWERPDKDSFIGNLMRENVGLKSHLESFKEFIKKDSVNEIELKFFLEKVILYNEHFLKLENILFPMLEKKNEIYVGLKVLWTLHDQTRSTWKQLSSGEGFNKELIGKLYFQLYGAMGKQELILFPCAVMELSSEEFVEMENQSFEYGFPYIETPKKIKTKASEKIGFDYEKQIFQLQTGHFNLEQLKGILDILPLDMTLVDENDKVAYFSKPKERIFPRSVAVIGRDVRNCHPSESVHIVEDILKAFKKGEKDSAEFWINIKGKKILIQYFPLRDGTGKYMGTLEMTQDITRIASLEGEQRLLNWKGAN